jgi:hypothetical protein
MMMTVLSSFFPRSFRSLLARVVVRCDDADRRRCW